MFFFFAVVVAQLQHSFKRDHGGDIRSFYRKISVDFFFVDTASVHTYAHTHTAIQYKCVRDAFV